MATFTLAQLKEKHGETTAKKVFSFEDIQRQQQVQKQTQGNQFELDKPKSFLGKARDFATSIIGGGKIGEGIGQAIAAPGIQRNISQEERETEALQQKLLTRIRERKQSGEDTSRLEKALKSSQDLATTLSDVQQDFGESLITGKEIAGSALRLGTTLAGGAIGRLGAKTFALGKATTFAGGALRGAGAGALGGGIFGGLQGAGLGLEAEKDLEGTLKSAATGTVLGVLAGGAIGTLTGGVSGVLKGKQIARENFAEEFVSPKLKTKVAAQAIKEGRFEDPGFFKKSAIESGRRDNLLAKSVDDVIKQKATVGQNIDAIRLKISTTNNGVKNYIKQNKVPFNGKQLNTRLQQGKDDLRLVFASDTTAEKTYNAVVKEFMRNVGKKDTLGLFEARQSFDNIPAIKKLLESQGLGENAKKEIVLQVRRKANEYVASLLPKGNTFRANLLQEHYMLESLGNIADKTVQIIGKNKLQILNEEYPLLKWIIGAGILGGGVGAGGTFIGSTD